MNIFLFHRDLRLFDNTSLIYQLKENKTIIPIFIFPPEQINPSKNKYFSHNSVQFMIESLHELSDDIKERSGKMYFFKGDNMTVLKELNKLESIKSIGFNLDYTPYAKERDKEIIDWCNDNNIKCYTKEDYALYDIINNQQTNKADGTPYLVFTPFYNHCINNLTVRPVDKYNNFHFIKISKLEDSKYHISEKNKSNPF
jgi:deoxyribodipyrimidine photo-lyase